MSSNFLESTLSAAISIASTITVFVLTLLTLGFFTFRCIQKIAARVYPGYEEGFIVFLTLMVSIGITVAHILGTINYVNENGGDGPWGVDGRLGVVKGELKSFVVIAITEVFLLVGLLGLLGVFGLVRRLGL